MPMYQITHSPSTLYVVCHPLGGGPARLIVCRSKGSASTDTAGAVANRARIDNLIVLCFHLYCSVPLIFFRDMFKCLLSSLRDCAFNLKHAFVYDGVCCMFKCSSLPSNQNGHSFMFFSGKGCSRPAGLPLQKRSVGEFWRIIVSNSLREAKSYK